jgi:hypothetical protein
LALFHQAGQDAHVSGQVAAALKSSANDLIEGGWDNGILKNFQVFEVLSSATKGEQGWKVPALP